MEHRLVTGIQKALGWDGPGPMGSVFSRGRLENSGLVERLMTPYRLLELVRTRHLSNPQLRCYAEGREQLPSAYLSDVISRRKQAARRADMAAVGRILNGGGTLVLDTVDSFDPTLEVACRALGWWSEELVGVNAYLAAGETEGFRMHWDDHDVICVQLAGEKSWEVRGASRAAPMYRDADPNLEPSDEVLWRGTMRTGDVMHIPRGHWHTATRIGTGADSLSLHVTFGFTKRTGITWIQRLADYAREHELFRTDLEGLGKADDRGERLVAALSELAREHEPARYLADFRVTSEPARHIPHVAAFGPLQGAVAVTEFEPSITLADHAVHVEAAGKRLSFAPRAEQSLRVLLSGHPVTLWNADPDLLQIAEHLIKEGLCAPLSDELSSGYTGLVPHASYSTPLPTSA
jgi:hypothetical protein